MLTGMTDTRPFSKASATRPRWFSGGGHLLSAALAESAAELGRVTNALNDVEYGNPARID